jgi:hypothetical protein
MSNKKWEDTIWHYLILLLMAGAGLVYAIRGY